MDKQIKMIREFVREEKLHERSAKAHYLNLGIDHFLNALEASHSHKVKMSIKEDLFVGMLDLRHVDRNLTSEQIVNAISVIFYRGADRSAATGILELPEYTFSMLRLKYPDVHMRGFVWETNLERNTSAVLYLHEEDSGVSHALIIARHNFFNTESNYRLVLRLKNHRHHHYVFPTLGEAKHFAVGEMRRQFHDCIVADRNHMVRPDTPRGIFSRTVIGIKRRLNLL